ncbi:MAG: response regulator [Candidatus Omnitrophota bacterium]
MARKLLIIDDEESLSASLKAFLSLKGYDVRVAHNGEEGLEEAARFLPELLLLDLHLVGGMTGTDTLKKAKSIIPGLKVVVLTGFGDEEEIASQCYSLGASKFLCKPLTATEIKNVLDEIK